MAGFFMLEKLKHPIVILLLKFASLYLVWFLFYDVWLRSPEITGPECAQMPEQTSELDNWMIIRTTSVAATILTSLGNEVNYDGARTIGIEGSSGLWMGDSCNAITLIALFTGLIIVFSGIWWQKLIYIFIGSICIWFLNVLRVVFLAIINYQSPELTEFNHTYTFTILIYAFIIFLWYWWIKKYSGMEILKNEPEN